MIREAVLCISRVVSFHPVLHFKNKHIFGRAFAFLRENQSNKRIASSTGQTAGPFYGTVAPSCGQSQSLHILLLLLLYFSLV